MKKGIVNGVGKRPPNAPPRPKAVKVPPAPPISRSPTPTERIPTELDNIMAGRLSTIWPLSGAHPEDSMHIAIFVNDLMRAAMKTINEQQEEIERLKTQEDRDLSQAEHYIAELETKQEQMENDILSLTYDIESRDQEIRDLDNRLAWAGEDQSDW